MPIRLVAHPPEHAALVRWLHPGHALLIGRAERAGLRLNHGSVSREHAVIERMTEAADAWRLRDLGSKNGSFVDGARVQDIALPVDCWLRFGDVFCECMRVDQAAADAALVDERDRRARATAHTVRIDGIERVEALLEESLRGVIELAQCERGCVLISDGDRTTVRASLGLAPEALSGAAFSGSVGALERAMSGRQSVVVNEIATTAWLANRHSVATAGLSALICLPLLDGDQVLGAIYADRVRPGPPITALDQALLEAFAERAALWLAARRMRALLDGDAPAPDAHDWRHILAAHGGGVA